MIPKKIHYCWFGGAEKPDEFIDYIDSWRRHNPGYEIIEWNESNFDVNINAYCREAYLSGNYAFVSDVCRMHALNRYGGVYLDTDVEVCQPFDSYMRLESFLGAEGVRVGAAVIGSEAGSRWTAAFMDYYNRRHFINFWGHPVRTPNTRILTERILPSIGAGDWPTIFPTDYFCAKDERTREVRRTPNTVAVHHFAASWRRKKTLGDRVSIILQGFKIRHKLGKRS